MSHPTKILAAILAIRILSACGGGGGGESPAPASSTYSIGGTVSGMASGAQVTLFNNGGDALTLRANGSFAFTTPVGHNGGYAVTVQTQPTGQVCTVSNGSGTGVIANVTNVQITCSTNTYTIGGSLSGLASGAQVTLLNNGGDALTITSNGGFRFTTPVAHNGSYAVTVQAQPTGQVCTVSNAAGAGATANVTNIQVTCSTNTYSVGGSLSGLASGAQVTLRDNNSDALTLAANGSFTFTTPIAYNGSYAVTVGTQPMGQVCTVNNGSGASVTANVTGVQVTCSTNTYTIGGNLSGLATGTQITLLNNTSDALTLTANGSFTFTTPISYNGSYAITVGTQPTNQSCTVANGAGANVSSNIGNIAIACTYVCTTTLTGILASDSTYALANSPYCISGNLQIPAGITAIFDAGTSVSGGALVVQGSLAINGTSTAKVNVTGVTIVPAGLQAAPHAISIAYANIAGGSLYAPTGNAIYGSLNLTDSTIRNLQSYLYLWYPIGSNTIARNAFIGSGGISYGIDFRNASVLSLSITNNYFEAWSGSYAIQNWVQYGTGAALIQQNTFAATSQVALKLPPGYTDTAMTAANNYWSTVDAATIQSMIYDKADDITTAGYINYLPFLTSPALGTPAP